MYHFHVEREMDEQTVECMDEKCERCRFMLLAFIFCTEKREYEMRGVYRVLELHLSIIW